jgi:hypothetical protein
MEAKKTQSGKTPAVDSPAVEAYNGGNATNSGSRIGTKSTGVYNSTGASLPQNENPHPKEFGVGASKGRGIFNGS